MELIKEGSHPVPKMNLIKAGSHPVPNIILRLLTASSYTNDFIPFQKKFRYNNLMIEFLGTKLNITDVKMLGLISKVYNQSKQNDNSILNSVDIVLTKEDICCFNDWNTSDYNDNRKDIIKKSLQRLRQFEITIMGQKYDTTYSIYSNRTKNNENESILISLNKLRLSPFDSVGEPKYEGTLIDLLYRKFTSKISNKEYFDFTYICFDSLNEIKIQTAGLLWAFLCTHNMKKSFSFSKIKEITSSDSVKNYKNVAKIKTSLDFLKSINMIEDYKINTDLLEWLEVTMVKKDGLLIEGEKVVKSSLTEKSYKRKLDDIERLNKPKKAVIKEKKEPKPKKEIKVTPAKQELVKEKKPKEIKKPIVKNIQTSTIVNLSSYGL